MTVTLFSVEGFVRGWFRSYPFGHGLSQLPLIQISGGVSQKNKTQRIFKKVYIKTKKFNYYCNVLVHFTRHGQACKVSFHDSKPGAELTSSVTHRPQARALSRTHRAGR